MIADEVIRARLDRVLKARLVRIAVRKQANPRAAAGCLREAVVTFVEKEEGELALPPITKREVKDLLNGKEAKAA